MTRWKKYIYDSHYTISGKAKAILKLRSSHPIKELIWQDINGMKMWLHNDNIGCFVCEVEYKQIAFAATIELSNMVTIDAKFIRNNIKKRLPDDSPDFQIQFITNKYGTSQPNEDKNNSLKYVIAIETCTKLVPVLQKKMKKLNFRKIFGQPLLFKNWYNIAGAVSNMTDETSTNSRNKIQLEQEQGINNGKESKLKRIQDKNNNITQCMIQLEKELKVAQNTIKTQKKQLTNLKMRTRRWYQIR